MHILLNTKRKLLCQGRFGEKDNNLRFFFFILLTVIQGELKDQRAYFINVHSIRENQKQN